MSEQLEFDFDGKPPAPEGPEGSRRRVSARYTFKNEKLCISYGGAIAVVKPWPVLLAFKRNFREAQSGWQHFRPDLDLRTGYLGLGSLHYSTRVPYEDHCPQRAHISACTQDEGTASSAYRCFLETVPVAVALSAARFPQRHWHLLALAARCPGALDLMQSSPALATCLASNWAFHRPAVTQPMRSARALIRRPQPEIAAWLSFPGTQAAAKVLRKVPPEACYLPSLFYLRQAMSSPEALRLLCHLQVINVTAIRVLSDPVLSRLAAPSLLLEITQTARRHGRISPVVGLLSDIRAMLQQRVHPRWGGPCRSLEEVERRHDQLAEELNQDHPAEQIRPTGVVFPPPPFPGTEVILPITSVEELCSEGRQQHNCVGSYWPRVLQQRCHIYRLMAPVRATFALVHGRGGWCLGEIAGRANRPVSAAVRHTVEHWLDSQDPF